MYNSVLLTTIDVVGSLPLFTFRYRDMPGNSHRSLSVVYGEDEQDCIVLNDPELSKGSTYEIRGDGIWSDLNCEVINEHWSLSCESFALRVPTDEYLAYKDTRNALLIGDRIPFGYELDVSTTNGDDWFLTGEILVEKSEINVGKLRVRFSLK